MADPSPSTEQEFRSVTEVLRQDSPIPLWSQPEWNARFPWLFQATTGRAHSRGAAGEFDYGFFGDTPSGPLLDRWRRLREVSGMKTSVHSRQVHGARTRHWREPLPEGFILIEGFDAHQTHQEGLLLTVSVADCVPVYLVTEEPRAVSLVHAGWRGTAAGIVESSIIALAESVGASPSAIWLHCGPSICGACYEVGPEVHVAVDPSVPPPSGPAAIDLPRSVARRAVKVGVDPGRITVTTHCTLCGPGAFFSHRGGSSGRQLGLLGRRPTEAK